MRIRSRLLLLVLAVLLPSLIAAAIAVTYVYQGEREFNYTSISETARALALALDRDMARRESILHTLAESSSLERGEFARFYSYASAIAKKNDAAIILSDLEGRQILNTRLPFGKPLPSMLPQEREERARLGNDVTLISDLYTPPAGLGPYSFAVQVPVRRDGRTVMFLTLATFASQMQKLLAEQRLPAGWLATILDRRGVIVARNMEPEKFVGRQARQELYAKISTQTEGFHEGVTLAGVHGTAFFSRAPSSGWVFLVSVPHTVLFGSATRAVLLMAVASMLLLGLGLTAALMVARRISRPIESLREAALRLGRNEPVQVPASATDELDAVGQAMADASDRLRGATAELEQRVSEAVASVERSQQALVQAQKLEALGRMTGGIAHDFNNILQTLTAGLQVLKHGATDAQRELLSRCERAVARGGGLARQLMAFGRVQEVRIETVDTATRLADARQLVAGLVPTNIELQFDLPSDLWPVTVDPAQLELAFLNLIINARDAMPSGGRLVLRGSNETVTVDRADLSAGEYVMLKLTDTGEGMSEEVMARALDPFYTTKGVGKGSGMGLPQAYGFARQNGGTLMLESRVGQGTTVTMYLPRARRTPSPSVATHALPRLPVSKGKVLLVEDDELVRETVSTALQAAGFEIRTAATADEALRQIDSGEEYDAVLTDVVMPGVLSGVDLAAHVRKRYPGIGVVVATGYSDRAVELPGVRTLSKPYDLQQAVEALNAVVAG
jgi:signal transduction histidine kinase